MNSAYHRLYRTLGINIAYYRNMKDMSQEQLGDRLEIDQSPLDFADMALVDLQPVSELFLTHIFHISIIGNIDA